MMATRLPAGGDVVGGSLDKMVRGYARGRDQRRCFDENVLCLVAGPFEWVVPMNSVSLALIETTRGGARGEMRTLGTSQSGRHGS